MCNLFHVTPYWPLSCSFFFLFLFFLKKLCRRGTCHHWHQFALSDALSYKEGVASSSDSTGVQALSGLGVELLDLCVGSLSVFNLTHARVMWESGGIN